MAVSLPVVQDSPLGEIYAPEDFVPVRSRRDQRPRHRVGGWAINLLVVLGVLVAVLMVLPGLLGYERYVITGGSMSGTFERGAVVVEQPVPVEQLRVGDVITYLPPADSGLTNLVTHRIVEKAVADDGALLFRTQGDANPDPDPWVFALESGVQPRMVGHVPHVGHLFIALGDRDTRMALLGVPAALIALVALREVVAGLRPRREEQAA